MLIAASVSGRVFASDLVSEVAGANPDALVEAFDEAERPDLSGLAADPGHLMFSHELIRQTLLADVSTVKRERLHLRAAEAIARRYSDDIEAHAGDLAYHLSHAGGAADRAARALPDDCRRAGLRRGRLRRRRRPLRARPCAGSSR